MLCQLSYCPPALASLLSHTFDPLAGRTKTMVRGHQTRESTEDYDESRTAASDVGTPWEDGERFATDDGTHAIKHRIPIRGKTGRSAKIGWRPRSAVRGCTP